MSAVESFDVAAAAVLIDVRRRMRRLGGSLQLVNLGPGTRAVLRDCGLARMLAA
jgi:anti-anti-sigma regulatory factor